MTLLKAVMNPEELWQGPTAQEWLDATAAAHALGRPGYDLEEQFQRCTSCLVMDFVPGPAFHKASEPFEALHLDQTASDLARCFLLLMIMGDPPDEGDVHGVQISHKMPQYCLASCSSPKYRL